MPDFRQEWHQNHLKQAESDPDELIEPEEEAIPLGRANTRPIPIQRLFDVPIIAVGQTWELHEEDPGDFPGPETPRGVRYRVLSIGADNTVLIARSASYRRVRLAAFDGRLMRYVGG